MADGDLARMTGADRLYRAAREVAALRAAVRFARRLVRSSDASFILLAVITGAAAALLTMAIALAAHGLQQWLFRLPPPRRLSEMPALDPLYLLILPLGGGALALFNRLVRARRMALIDAVEANALHGGRMSVLDGMVIAVQTILSNGFGASVGLEAAYAQAGATIGSIWGRALALRRADVRTLVGAGAGAAIAAAFGAPLAGAFYAFEVVLGAYTPSSLAPVAAAALSGSLVARAVGWPPYLVDVAGSGVATTFDYLCYAAIGGVCALSAIGVMRAVALVEIATRKLHLAPWARPIVGGLCLIPLASHSPQVLSAGHGAMLLDLAVDVPLASVALLLAAKSAASIISLGFGFRGGLFFASLFLGTLVSHLVAIGLAVAVGHGVIDLGDAELVGLAAFGAAVIGSPMTMAMLVLEATRDFPLTGAVIAACLVSSTIARAAFGYSFSTWRLHLRGETIRSARDVGWVKTLTAGRMMRAGPQTTPEGTTIAEFRRRFPLGSVGFVLIEDEGERYAGLLDTASAFADGLAPDAAVATIARCRDVTLEAAMDIEAVMRGFDAAQQDVLAVVDGAGRILGTVAETHVRRRYADELSKAQRELFGEVRR